MKAGSIVSFSQQALDNCSHCVFAALDGIEIFQLNLRQMLLRLRLAATLADWYCFPVSQETMFILKNLFVKKDFCQLSSALEFILAKIQ